MASSSQHNPGLLVPSELGTKEYWNALYTRELSNHASNPDDIGTVWFDDSDAESKMVQFLDALSESQSQSRSPSSSLPILPKHTTSILDLGCGNGSMLFSLREQEDWSGRALGIDYSPQSVALAKQISRSMTVVETETQEDDATAVEFSEWDIIAGPYSTVLNGAQESGWDVVLDKGTFDAISLSDEQAHGRRLCELYCHRVLPLVRKGGIFLITSCNWTEEELANWFVAKKEDAAAATAADNNNNNNDDNSGNSNNNNNSNNNSNGKGVFVVAGRVEHRTFSFGGAKGQTISTMCFRKV
ncbi:Protein-lysine N-methyltransferase efm4 [Conoideocrella luteorostrata]|uniref:Protein-lysine N-methyltransferase EFM4 n=1 Tax=Conoideocrella luteorostrata TaxID=1105319 RepID=A0AAJ0CBX5_9HYPO|nr:Protein-lysine N-methyltransferase efm4 [Conoideocrella luteorostrata]